MSLIGENAAALPPDLIKDGADATFMADVIESSKTTPVIVDFWATWCGPCRQLTPALEKAVKAAKGAVKLVKIDIDKHPAFARELRVESVPTVYAFSGGRPVDAFTGAQPESKIKEFIARLAGPAGASELDTLIAEAREDLAAGDTGGAAQGFAQALQMEPGNLDAIGGLARCYLAGGDTERAQEVADMAPGGAKNADLESVRAALTLAASAPADASGAEKRLAADPGDHEARMELAKSLAAKGRFEAAADALLTIVAADRDWNEGAARKELLTVFEAAGPASEVARQGRKRLSSLLFA